PNAAALLAEVAQLQASLGASGQPSLAQPALARSVPPTAAMAQTPPPFDSPLVTPSGTGPSTAGGSAASMQAAPAPKTEARFGLLLGGGIGLLLLLFAGATAGGVYLLTRRDSSSSADGPRAGSLGPGDQTIPSGEYADRYEFDWPEGTQVHLELRSSQFDPYLIVKPPSGRQLNNDDASPGDRSAALDFTASPGGRWRVLATSYSAGEVGDYQLLVKTGAGM
ncbi:MAG: hypothetical protein GXP55_20420, partial [Deltaproteobacteria bacterium]|nr:hypothetical protein [Deltaproteobacteria bacterium]